MQLKKTIKLEKMFDFSRKISVLAFLGVGLSAYAAVPVHPYWDQGGMSGVDLTKLNNGTGTDGGVYPVIAFANAMDASCKVGLAGTVATPLNPHNFYALSFGGANGIYVTDCVVGAHGHNALDPFTNQSLVDSDAQQVASLIYTYLNDKAVFDSVPTQLDFDVENSSQTAFTKAVRFRALHFLQGMEGMSGLKASFTLPVLAYGLVPTAETGQYFLRDLNSYLTTFADDPGTWFGGINLMTMDYGATFPDPLPANQPNNTAGWTNGTTFEQAVIGAVANTYAQITGVGYPAYGSSLSPPPAGGYPKVAALFTGSTAAKMSVTPMIGQNDTANEQFYLSEASQLSTDWANASFPHGDIRYWSMNRDQVCHAPFPLASSNPTCSGMLQSVSFSQDTPKSSFYNAMVAGAPVVPPLQLPSQPALVMAQTMDGSKYTPYYQATVTPVAGGSGAGYYMTVMAKPTGIDSAYNTDKYKAILKTIPGCSFLTSAAPASGYPKMFSPIQYINNTALAPFSVFEATQYAPGLCPFTDYSFSYYVMPYDGDWSTTPADFKVTPPASLSPVNQVAKGTFVGPIGAFNTVAHQTNGMYLAANAVPDWGLPTATITIGTVQHELPAGSYLLFDPAPASGVQWTVTADYPPNYTVPLESGTYPDFSARSSALLLAVFDGLNGYDSNIAFVGAPTKITPVGAELSTANFVGAVTQDGVTVPEVQLSWGHISTNASSIETGPLTFTMNVSKDGSIVYSSAAIPDNTAADANTLTVSQGLDWNTEYDYSISANAKGVNWVFPGGDAFTGSFTLPINISRDKLSMTVARPPYAGSAQGYGMVSTFTNVSGKNLPFVDGTELVFLTPFNASIYGETQYANHDCGDPMANTTNGVKTGASAIGNASAPSLSGTSTYVVQNGQAYCKNDFAYSAPTGVFSIPAGSTWVVPVSVTTNAGGNSDPSFVSDQQASITDMQANQLALQPYGSDQTNCSVHFYVPNVPDVIGHIPLSTAPTNSCPVVPAMEMSVVMVNPTAGDQWKMMWPATGQCSMPSTITKDAPFSSVSIDSKTGIGTAVLATDNSFSWTNYYTGVTPSCTGSALYDYVTGKTGQITLTDGTQTINCRMTVEYVTIPSTCTDR